MAGERREATFQQLLDEGMLEIGDGYRAQNNELGGTGPIFLRAGHVTDSHIDFAGVEQFHEHLAEKVRSKMSKVGDTIITTKGNSTGRTSFVTERLPPFVYSPHLSYWRSRDPEKLCGGFLRYWSQGVEFIEQLSGMKASTDMAPYLSLTDQRRLSITLPPLAEQKAIAAVLGALDDKIELNRRMNATLEAMARALFQSWFVDFDPVRAKLDGRQPAGMDTATAALFPDSFYESELGQIPSGWSIHSLDDVINVKHGFAFEGKYFCDEAKGDILLTPGNFAIGGGFKGNKLKYYDGPVPAEYVLNNHDLVLTMTDLSKAADTLGYPAMIPPPPVGFRFLHNQRLGKVIISRPEIAAPHYLYRLFCSDAYRHEILAGATGTTVKHTSPSRITAFRAIFPTPEVMKIFEDQVNAWYLRLTKNEDESRTLATLRDTLLPKLLSGELSVTTASEQLEKMRPSERG